jgi:hypothetical protein
MFLAEKNSDFFHNVMSVLAKPSELKRL